LRSFKNALTAKLYLDKCFLAEKHFSCMFVASWFYNFIIGNQREKR